ncbi:microtubule organization protein AKNA [Anoplopoma fimbria]|uniref:microtubule organization protein AKNA n=1 Tax=Anoplopoma fimbria TaxID=229290 RepID=UPI0023ECF345|nr:microtubule organization protein AKNA [Anoplopoma fimbria]
METRKNTTAGVLFWTPAPVRTSPTSSVISEDEWEDEVEEEPDDFVRQMDENGIIGLSEALEDVELEASCCDSDAESSPNLYPGTLTPEEADPSGSERDTAEELSYSRSEHLSHNESQEEDVQILSPVKDVMDRAEEQGIESVPMWDKYLDVTEEEENGQEAGTRSDRNKNKNKDPSTLRELEMINGLAESYISKGEIEEISSTQSCSAHLLAMGPGTVSNHHCPIAQPASLVTAPTFPHLPHFTAEELAAAPGIDAETFPEISFTESPPESHRSHISLKSSPRAEVKLRASLQPAAMFSEEGVSNRYSGVNNGPLKASYKSGKTHIPTPSPRKMRQHSPEATYSRNRSLSVDKADSLKLKQWNASPSPAKEQRTPRARNNAAEMDESRKGPLSYRTPDFSKVEPRVRFPKDGYNPPKSRRSSKRKSLSPEPPLVFKSLADFVKEVLLNTTDGSPTSSDSYKPPTSAPNSTVPQEFRSRQQATTLLDQLEEDYNRLLTKYAEAENTIDRLRLQAKVNLYSDPPKPGHLVQSGLNRDTSKYMMLDFPQAQRAEFNSASLHPNGHSHHQRSSSACPSTRSPDSQVGQQLAKILYNQADKFLQQLQTFEDLLKSKQLRPFDQMKGLSQLAEGLNSLERGYLLARDEHKVLQQHGAQISPFDSERELEGLIFQCGLQMDELKEQVEQMQQEQPTCVAPPSPPPHPTPSSVPSEGGQTLIHPQSPPVPLLVDPGQAAAVEVSSASEESDEEEEALNSLYFKPTNGKQRHVEQDFGTLLDHYQSFKELPKLLDNSQRQGAYVFDALRSDMQPADEEKERQSHRTGDLEVQKSVPQRIDESDHLDSPPVRSIKQQTSRSSSPSRRTSSQSTTPTVHPLSSRRRLEVGKSHSSSLSSLGEINALVKRNSKLQIGTNRVPSQDGIISPETDSGFVCSDSPLHQRASVSVSVPQEGNPGNPHIGPVTCPSPASSPSNSHAAMESRSDSRFSRDQQKSTRQGQRRRTFSCSPQRYVCQTEKTRADSGTSEFGLESDGSHTVSEDRQNEQYIESINSLHNSSPSSSPAAMHRHGNSLRALSSSQVANRNDAIQKLQAEVTRLRERLESCVRNRTPLSSVTSTPRISSGQQRGDDSRGGRNRQTLDEIEESTLRRTTRKRPPSAHRQRLKTQMDNLKDSEPSSPKLQPLVSRCTQTSTAAPDSCCSHTDTVRCRIHPRQHPGVSVPVSVTVDEPDSRGRRAPLCPQCLSRHQGRSEIGGNREPAHFSRSHGCPLCGRLEPSISTEPDCRRVSESPTHISCHPVVSPDRAVRSGYFAAAAPPALLQCMPVCPPPLLLYTSPLYVSPSHSKSSGVRGRREKPRRFQSSDEQHSVDTSLHRAIRAARHMKHTSGHMARSLASGLQYQENLTHSCSY